MKTCDTFKWLICYLRIFIPNHKVLQLSTYRELNTFGIRPMYQYGKFEIQINRFKRRLLTLVK